MDNGDFCLDENNDIATLNGDFRVADGRMDDCLIISYLNKGALKMDPVLGPNLIRMTNAKISEVEVLKALRVAFERDNKFASKLSIVEGKIDIQL